jgi:hypothetical protein
MMSDASAFSCKGSIAPRRAAISDDVATLRKIEHEASDRLKGLDTRPFTVLRDEARKTAAIIGPPGILKLEKELERCRNRTYSIHAACAAAGNMLADILEKYVAATKPDYDKAAYAAAIKNCEGMMDLKPIASAIRGTE